jgi:large subunit ribosomal protein L31e
MLMAKEGKVEQERIYTIPLRAVKNAPKWRRSKKAISEIFIYLSRHLKADIENIKLDSSINEKIWERSSGKPPNKITVRAMKFEDGIVEAELVKEA